MAKIAGATGNVEVQRQKFNKMVSKGEGLIGSDFEMTIEGWGDDTILVVSAQLPPLYREMIESFAQYGVRILQQGNLDTAFEMPISFKEVIKGNIYSKLREWITNKEYKEVTLKMIPESTPSGVDALSFVFHNCWIRLDGIDLTVEDRASLVKPAGTMHCHFFPDES